jgi:hypothetical protein
MKKILIFVLLTILDAKWYEDKFYKDSSFYPNISVHTDLGYSSYMVELKSSELNSAIDYNILEFNLGVSYSYNSWIYGIYSKFTVDELRSNMNIVTTGKKLNDHAKIDKNEFVLYINHILDSSNSDIFRVNSIYRYSNLDAVDSYKSYYKYKSSFKYKTQGFAISLDYTGYLNSSESFSINSGLIYTEADVRVFESIEGSFQDSFIDDNSYAIGARLSIGYNYKILSNLFLNIRSDFWRLNFSKLIVKSRVGDRLPKATLKEESFSSHIGFTYSF